MRIFDCLDSIVYYGVELLERYGDEISTGNEYLKKEERDLIDRVNEVQAFQEYLKKHYREAWNLDDVLERMRYRMVNENG